MLVNATVKLIIIYDITLILKVEIKMWSSIVISQQNTKKPSLNILIHNKFLLIVYSLIRDNLHQ